MDKRDSEMTRKPSRWFITGAVFCCLLAVGLLGMMLTFARNPDAAPPGILRHLFLVAPALLMAVIIISMLQYVKQLRHRKET